MLELETQLDPAGTGICGLVNIKAAALFTTMLYE